MRCSGPMPSGSVLLLLLSQATGHLQRALDEDVCVGNCGVQMLQRSLQPHPAKDLWVPEISVINLEARKDRWETMEKRLAELGDHVTRFAATDGKTTAVPDNFVAPVRHVKEVMRTLLEYHLGLDVAVPEDALESLGFVDTWTDGERACAMSHIRVWQQVAQESAPRLVLEDDAKPMLAWKDLLSLLSSSMEMLEGREPDVLYLNYNTIEGFAHGRLGPLGMMTADKDLMAKMGAQWLSDKLSNASWQEDVGRIGEHKLLKADWLFETGGYLIWPKGAQKLLANLPVTSPVDTFLGNQTHFGHIDSYAIAPGLINQDNSTSDVDPTIAARYVKTMTR
ncbi:unnamed protein product [Effrenium voratum]|uniref:Glycosyl transferase family 25 domain-containing protein n=1 Tax=Effrenium voratum TaxID=2562239 RepID=A0AA36IUW6_9DINO|nr:unnamed protein product [Effrenium voratum]CAJ1394330.1 unnamed protein product [Effrenium voratum]